MPAPAAHRHPTPAQMPHHAGPPAHPVRPFPLYAGLALTTCSMLLAQQFLTRVFSILFNSGFAFLAVSVTFLGLGSAGVCAAVLPRWFTLQRIPRLLAPLAVAYALLLVAGFMAMVAADHALAGGGEQGSLAAQSARVIGSSLLILPAMFACGLVISLLLRCHAARVNRLYGADLAGGGVGCILVLPLMNQVGGDQGIFAIGLLAALGAVLLAVAHGRARARAAALACAVAMPALAFANRGLALVDVESHRTVMSGVRDTVLEDRELRRDWNEQSRLGFFPMHDGASLYVRIDSSCQTAIPSLQPEHVAILNSQAGFVQLPWVLNRHRRYLEIGAGGGRGMLLAKAKGSESITGVEINPGIVAATLGGIPDHGVDYGIGPLIGPQFRLVEGEGRSWTRSSRAKYDTVTITFIQTNVAAGSAAFALSEANLFTVEAFSDFLDRLDDDGLFYVYRHGGNEMLRLISLCREALAARGIRELRPHLYVARNPGNDALLMVSLRSFTAAEVDLLDRNCRAMGIEITCSPSQEPGARPANPFPERVRELRRSGRFEMGAIAKLLRELAHDPAYETLEYSYVTCADPAAFLAEYPIDVRPTTDDRPYFFFNGLNRPGDFLHYFDREGTQVLGGIVVLLFWMAVAFTVLVVLLVLLPLLFSRRLQGSGTRMGLPVVLYFSGLGIGYIAVQISFIQRFTLFLGHPVYAVSVVLLSFLVCSGLGSLASDRLFKKGLGFTSTVLILGALLLAWNSVLPAVFASGLIALPVPAKIALSFLLILPLAFLMGCLFPQGIRLVDRAAPQLTPWAWGANSAASVLGSIFALIFAIHLGFSVVAVIAAVAYAVLCIPAARVMRRWQPAAT